jgi:hypothetical protein
MEQPGKTPERREKMNTQAQAQAQAQAAILRGKRDAPLFASPWMALFLLLRREWTTPRAKK